MEGTSLISTKRIGIFLSIILGLIVVVSNLYYLLNDRFNILSELKEKTTMIVQIEKRLTKLETDKKMLNDIQYNLKRLLEKNEIPWMPFDETGK